MHHTLLSLSLALLTVISPSLLRAADDAAATPQALVTELYQSEKKGASPFEEQKGRKLADHYFTKALADLIVKDGEMSKKNNEPGVLDFAPLYGAQDLEIKKLVINKAVTAKGKTTVLVSFLNYDQKMTTKFDLVQQDGAWKISDIHYTNGPSLMKLFQEADVKP